MMNFSSQGRQDLQAVELRQLLLEQVNVENEKFTELLKSFNGSEGCEGENTQAICDEIIALVDRVLAIEGWQDSLFLRNLMKPLEQAKDEAQAILDSRSNKANVGIKQNIAIAEDEVVLYMTLYQAQGYDLNAWSLQLRSIKHTMLGRPIYSDEESARTTIRSKVDQSRDAYVVLRVKREYMMNHAAPSAQFDRHNNKLVTLEQGAIATESILEFVYMNNRYHFTKGVLSVQQSEGGIG